MAHGLRYGRAKLPAMEDVMWRPPVEPVGLRRYGWSSEGRRRRRARRWSIALVSVLLVVGAGVGSVRAASWLSFPSRLSAVGTPGGHHSPLAPGQQHPSRTSGARSTGSGQMSTALPLSSSRTAITVPRRHLSNPTSNKVQAGSRALKLTSSRRRQAKSTNLVTAARPGVAVAGPVWDPHHSPIAPTAGEAGISKKTRLRAGEGAGPEWCIAAGGFPFGASLDGVFACGPGTSPATPFDTDGFQCVELSERFLWDVYGRIVRKVDSGADFVPIAHRRLHIPVGYPGHGSLPQPGDIVSLWGPTADPAGHTGVVSAVNVGQHGNGAIQIMEENGSASGWDQIDVHHWRESFGRPGYLGGYYYYTHVSWLKLAKAVSPVPAPGGTPLYTIHPLGPAASEATGINDLGRVAGVVDVRDRHQRLVHQVLSYADAHATIFKPPKSDRPMTASAGVDREGNVAAWGLSDSGRLSPYVIRAARTTRWFRLPTPRGARGQPLSMNAGGDVTGWYGSGTARSLGAVWRPAGHGYRLHTLHANHGFRNPLVAAADAQGDAVGTEMLDSVRTFGVLWTPNGRAYRLPPVSAHRQLTMATAITSTSTPNGRILFITGSSRRRNGAPQACMWRIRVAAGRVFISRPRPLWSPAGYGPSWARAVNPAGYVVGELGRGRARRAGFLWRPGWGMATVNSLLPQTSGWSVLSLDGINAAGAMVGVAIQQGHAPYHPMAVLLTPARLGLPPKR